MEGHRFDVFTRLLTRGESRRRLLRALGAGVAAVAGLGSVQRTTAHSTPGLACGQDSNCVIPDADPCTGVECIEGSCIVSIVTCAPGYTCCGNGQCCSTSDQCLVDADCAVEDADPCTGSHCDQGVCVVSLVTCAAGFTCCGNGACCPDWWPDEWPAPEPPPR